MGLGCSKSGIPLKTQVPQAGLRSREAAWERITDITISLLSESWLLRLGMQAALVSSSHCTQITEFKSQPLTSGWELG